MLTDMMCLMGIDMKPAGVPAILADHIPSCVDSDLVDESSSAALAGKETKSSEEAKIKVWVESLGMNRASSFMVSINYTFTSSESSFINDCYLLMNLVQ